jgi:hypothetical protein
MKLRIQTFETETFKGSHLVKRTHRIVTHCDSQVDAISMATECLPHGDKVKAVHTEEITDPKAYVLSMVERI